MNLMNPKVSVIVPIYGVEKYLDRCMQSLLKQTLQDIEIILVDDGSPDDCPKLCDEYALLDDRVRVIHKENAGLGFARNSGLDIARGKYISFVDSDDYVELSMMELLLSYADKYDADVVSCGSRYVNGNIIVPQRDVESLTILSQDMISDYCLDMIAAKRGARNDQKYFMSVWRCIFKRQIIDEYEIKFYSERDIVSEDIPFKIDVGLHSKTVVFVPDLLYYYCQNGSSLTSIFIPQKFNRYVELRKLLLEKTSHLSFSKDRVDRFFISSIRSLLLHSVKVLKKEDWLIFISDIAGNPVWKEISSFDIRILSWSKRVILFLFLHGNMVLLYFYLSLFNEMKKLNGKCRL
ncbi:MAG: glycosyltransferase [Dysgonamonadaceae bacterium]